MVTQELRGSLGPNQGTVIWQLGEGKQIRVRVCVEKPRVSTKRTGWLPTLPILSTPKTWNLYGQRATQFLRLLNKGGFHRTQNGFASLLRAASRRRGSPGSLRLIAWKSSRRKLGMFSTGVKSTAWRRKQVTGSPGLQADGTTARVTRCNSWGYRVKHLWACRLSQLEVQSGQRVKHLRLHGKTYGQTPWS